MTMKVGVNGFGRIGRDFVREYFEGEVKDFDLVAINASGDLKNLALLFKYDSVYGKFDGEIEAVEDGFMINGKKVTVTSEKIGRASCRERV